MRLRVRGRGIRLAPLAAITQHNIPHSFGGVGRDTPGSRRGKSRLSSWEWRDRNRRRRGRHRRTIPPTFPRVLRYRGDRGIGARGVFVFLTFSCFGPPGYSSLELRRRGRVARRRRATSHPHGPYVTPTRHATIRPALEPASLPFTISRRDLLAELHQPVHRTNARPRGSEQRRTQVPAAIRTPQACLQAHGDIYWLAASSTDSCTTRTLAQRSG